MQLKKLLVQTHCGSVYFGPFKPTALPSVASIMAIKHGSPMEYLACTILPLLFFWFWREHHRHFEHWDVPRVPTLESLLNLLGGILSLPIILFWFYGKICQLLPQLIVGPQRRGRN